MTPSELQAVVMAGGRGSRMTELTAGRPKCLLPIGNLPMIWYPLHLLERAGFQEAFVVILESDRNDVQNALDKCILKMKIDYVCIPDEEDWGTADSLRHIGEKIKADILVVSCDLITQAELQNVLDIHRKHQASLTTLFFPSKDFPTVAPGPKTKYKPERDLIGLDGKTNRLVFLASVSDFEDTIPLQFAFLEKHSYLKMNSNLLDSHLYVMKKWVVDFLQQEKYYSTLKGELLPYIIKKQLSRPAKFIHQDPNATIEENEESKGIREFAAEDALLDEVRTLSAFTDHIDDNKAAYHGDYIRCYAHVANQEIFGMRINTLPSYCHINKQIVELWPTITGDSNLTAIHPSSEVKTNQVDEASMIGEHCKVSEKTSVKSSIIGPSCNVEPKVRITNSILMSGVKVCEGATITNCILCDSVEIGSNSDLKDCLVGSRHVVASGAKHAQAILTDEEAFMEI